MPTISLQDIRDAADRKYGPLVIAGIDGGDVTLLNPLRLPAARRKEMTGLDEVEDLDQDSKLRRIVELAAETPAQGKRLLKAVGDDMGLLAQLLENYGKGVQVGEASTSPS